MHMVVIKFFRICKYVLHKYDLKQRQIFTQVFNVDKENPNKQTRQKILGHLFIEKNDSVLHICEG